MLFNLVRKEFIKKRETTSSSKWMRLISVLIKLIFIGCFIALESITLLSLDKKISEYSSYGTFDFLILYNFVVLIIAIIMVMVKARKVVFAKNDNRVTMTLPISKEKIIFAKSIYLYLYAVIALTILATPSLVCYGQFRQIYAYYYVFAFVYPWLVSLLVLGIASMLAPLVELFYRSIKFSDLLQFALASGLVIGLCFGYQFVLNLFLTALSSSSVGGLFDENFVNGLHNAVNGFVPVIHILRPILETDHNAAINIVLFVIEIISFALSGFAILAISFDIFNNKNFEVEIKNKKDNELKITSPSKALIKKEFMMLFKNDAYTFSYTSLLILAPFLSFAVISSLNAIIYENLRFYSQYFPEIINGLNLTLVLLFLTVINSGASLSMSREGKALQIVKYLPISPIKQIIVKLIVPMTLSFASLLITLIALISGGVIDVKVFFMALLIGALILFADNVLSIEWDMHDKGTSKFKLSGLNILLSLGYPLFLLFIHLLMSFCYCPAYSIYLTEALLAGLLLIPCFIKIKSRYINAFNGMEAN